MLPDRVKLARLSRGVNSIRLLSRSICLAFFLVAGMSAADIVANPSSLVANVDPGHTKLVSLSISSSGGSLTVTPSVASGSAWLAVLGTPVSTPATLFVFFDGRFLSEGVYTGSLTLTASGAGNSPLTVPVTLTVGTPPGGTFLADQSSLSFVGQVDGTAPASQHINVSSTPSGTTFSAAAATTSGGSWLSVSPASGTTPAQVTVSVNIASMSAGTYSGSVTLTPATGTAVTVSVTLTLTTAPVFSASPSALSFTGQSGGSVGSQQLTITSSPSGTSFTASAATSSGGNWLQASQAGNITPSTVTVSVQTSGLSAGTYSGTITLTPSTGTAVTVSVTLTLTATSLLTSNPTSLSFTGQAGFSPPASQQLSITSSAAGNSFSVTVTPSSASTWLQVSPLSGTPPTTLVASVSTQGLTAGSYSATITLTPTTGLPLTIPVTLTLSSGLTVSATSLQFSYQVGSSLPAVQTVTVGGISGVAFTVAATTNTTEATGWLTATPQTGTVPQTVTVNASPLNLAPGTYHGNVRVSSVSASVVFDISVTLTVSSSVVLTVGASPSTFYYQPGKTVPAPQTVALGSPGTTLSFTAAATTADGASWLAVAPAKGTTPQNLTISVAPQSLSPGGYSGSVIVTAAGASNSPVVIPVNLIVNSTTTLVSSAKSVVLNYQIGGANQVLSQPVSITAIGDAVTVSARAATISSSCAANWLQVVPSSFTTPGVIYVAVEPLVLGAPGSCLGSIILSGGGPPIEIPVTANVATTPFLNIRPQSLSLATLFQSDLTGQTISLSMTDNSVVTFLASTKTVTPQSWLYLAPTQGSTPATVTVGALSNVLPIGNYSGTITITSPALPQGQEVPVVLQVNPSTTASVAPVSLVFDQIAGGSPPQAQSITISTTPGSQAYSAQVNQGSLPSQVLSITPVSGVTPGSITVGMFANSLPVGTYNASVSISVRGTSGLTVPVTIRVSNPPVVNTIATNPAALIFSYQQNGESPTSQQINVTSTGDPVDVIASATGGNWITIFPRGKTTPGTFLVAADPAGMGPGTYNGTVSFTPSGGTVKAVSVPVSLEVKAVPPPSIAGIANVASGVRGPVSPGEIIMIGGTALGPSTGVQFQLTGGKVGTALAGTTVLFDEVPAPLLYVSSGQINAVVPYEIAGRTTVTVKVKVQGISSDGYVIQTASAAPGIFTAGQNGRGQGAILNEDNTVNSAASAARRGSIVQVYATGEGLTQPPAVTGSVTAGIVTPVGKVSATVGEIPAEVVFAGAAPQAVAGLFQVNLRIPQNALAGSNTLSISVGGISSQTGVTVAVK